MGACRLIVHADDFGLSVKVNEGILKAHREGILTSTSIMAVGNSFDHAVKLAQSTITLDIGIHLTLIEEKPISRQSSIPTLLDKNGNFYNHANKFVRQFLLGSISLNDIRYELDAQIHKVLAHGIKISHLDSHQHIHMLPGIHKVVGKLAQKYSIPAIRFPKEDFKLYMFKEKFYPLRLLQLLALNLICATSGSSRVNHPEFFLGFFFGGKLIEKNLWKILKFLPESGDCELMCHPGKYDPSGLYAHWDYQWQDELSALMNADVRRILKQKGVELISFADLYK